MSKTQTITPRLASVVVAQKTASVALDDLKEKKSYGISTLKPEVKVENVSKEDGKIVAKFVNGESEATVVYDGKTIAGERVTKDVKPEYQEVLNLDSVDTTKFGDAVVEIANRNIKNAIKVSKASATNPNLYRKPKAAKKVAASIF